MQLGRRTVNSKLLVKRNLCANLMENSSSSCQFGKAVAGTSTGTTTAGNAPLPDKAKPKISLINPETGQFSPKEDEEAYFDVHDLQDSNSSDFPDQVEIKPDPLTLLQSKRKRRSFNDIPDFESSADENDYNHNEGRFEETRKKGGRTRDPVWQEFHNIGGNAWQCNDCHYSLVRPQADRMRKHRLKCQSGLETTSAASVTGNNSRTIFSNNDDKEEEEDPFAAPASASFKTSSTSANNLPSVSGLSQFKTNSISRQLRRIADALEESNKLKKLKLGLDPYIPFDGEHNGKR